MRALSLFLLFWSPFAWSQCGAVSPTPPQASQMPQVDDVGLSSLASRPLPSEWGLSYDMVEVQSQAVGAWLDEHQHVRPFKELLIQDPKASVSRISVMQVVQQAAVNSDKKVGWETSYTLIHDRSFPYFLEVKERGGDKIVRVGVQQQGAMTLKDVSNQQPFAALFGLVSSSYDMWMLGQASAHYFVDTRQDAQGRITRAADPEHTYDVHFEYEENSWLPVRAHLLDPKTPDKMTSILFYRRDEQCQRMSWSENDLLADASKVWLF